MVSNNNCHFFSGGHELQALIDIIDSMEHMTSGGVKDVESWQSSSSLWCRRLTPNLNCLLFNVIAFDAAANVQKGGQAIAARFPQAIVIHGAEHERSLFLATTFKEPKLNLLKTFTTVVSFLLFTSYQFRLKLRFHFHSLHNAGTSLVQPVIWNTLCSRNFPLSILARWLDSPSHLRLGLVGISLLPSNFSDWSRYC